MTYVPHRPGFPVLLNVQYVFAKRVKRLFRRSIVKYYAAVDIRCTMSEFLKCNPLAMDDLDEFSQPCYVEISELFYHRILIQRDNNIKDKR